MDQQTQKKLAEKGWKFGTVAEFLNLSPKEEILVETKLALAAALKNSDRPK